jgi:hypothetical protein
MLLELDVEFGAVEDVVVGLVVDVWRAVSGPPPHPAKRTISTRGPRANSIFLRTVLLSR